MSAHALLAPSSADRWFACPGSIAAERRAPDRGSSEFADTGTQAHALFASALLRRLAAEQVTSDPVLSRPLAVALTTTRNILAGRAFMVELRLRPLADLSDVWGTADVVGFSFAGPIDTIIDLKFGEALAVEAGTPQLAIYSLLAARRFGVAAPGVTAWIVQPRCAHASGPARSKHYSLADLDRFEAELRRKAAATRDACAPRLAGAWCRFCGGQALCETRRTRPDAVATLPSAFFRPSPPWLSR